MKNSRQVILFAYYFPPCNAIGARRPARFAKYLPLYDFETHVICNSGGISYEQNIEGSQILGVPDANTRKTQFGQLVDLFMPLDDPRNWNMHASIAAASVIENHDICAVISTSSPLVTHAVAATLKRTHGIKWIADLRDPIVGNPAFPENSPVLTAVEALIAKSADAILTTTDVTATDFARRHPECARKVEVLWNGFDPIEDIPLLSCSQDVERLNTSGRRVIAHVGSIYSNRTPFSLLASCARLLGRSLLRPDELLIRLIGSMEDYRTIMGSDCAQALLERGCLDASGHEVTRAEAIDAMRSADALLLLDMLDRSGSSFAVPGKLYEYILTGKPILAVTSHDSPVERILNHSGLYSTQIYYDDSDELVDAKVLEFIRRPLSANKPSERFLHEFNGRNQVARLGDLLCKLVQSNL